MSNIIDEILSMGQLQTLVIAGETDWSKYGNVKATYWDGLVLFNYTNAAQYAGNWNWFERNCRGLILNTSTGEIVARPFPKFFNYGQDLPVPGSKIKSITEKLDGSLGILYRHKGELRVATRGSFDSDQALWATNYLKEYGLTVQSFPDEMTFLFEIIYPENRVVVDYKGSSAMYLIGAINRHYGDEEDYAYLAYQAQWLGFPLAKQYGFDTIEEVLSAAEALDANHEGWVLRYNDNSRFKVKGEAYKLAHKMLTGVSYGRVLEAVMSDKYDQMIEGIPDEFLAVIKEYKREIDEAYYEIAARVNDIFVSLPMIDNRKDIALWLKANHPEDMHYIFALLDRKPVNPLIYKAISQRERVQQESDNGLA